MRGQPAPAAAAGPKPDFNGHAAPPHMNGGGYQQSPTGLPTPAVTPVPGGRSAYVPPGRTSAPNAASDGGWGAPAPRPQARTGGGFGGGASAPPGFGSWKNGHIVGQRNQRMEAELFGTEGDGVHQVSHLLTANRDPRA